MLFHIHEYGTGKLHLKLVFRVVAAYPQLMSYRHKESSGITDIVFPDQVSQRFQSFHLR